MEKLIQFREGIGKLSQSEIIHLIQSQAKSFIINSLFAYYHQQIKNNHPNVNQNINEMNKTINKIIRSRKSKLSNTHKNNLISEKKMITNQLK